MTQVEIVREAAQLMRADAEEEAAIRRGDRLFGLSADGEEVVPMTTFERRLTPAVSLAVADWLDSEAAVVEHPDSLRVEVMPRALDVALAYLEGA